MTDNSGSASERTLYCGNLPPDVDEEILFELFVQAGPLEKVSLPKRDGYSRGFGFIIFKHESSVRYAMQLFRDTQLFGRVPKLQFRSGARQEDSNGSYHQRSQSLPLNLSGGLANEPPMNFDALLAMSKNMLSGTPGMSYQQDGPPILPPDIPQIYPPGVPPSEILSLPSHPVFIRPPSGFPPFGQEGSAHHGGGSYHQDGNPSDQLSQHALSMNSLQGNWSARQNDCSMRPHDHRSRRDRNENRGGRDRSGYDSQSWDRGRDRGRDYDKRYERYHDGRGRENGDYHHRSRNHGKHSRSDHHERRRQ